MKHLNYSFKLYKLLDNRQQMIMIIIQLLTVSQFDYKNKTKLSLLMTMQRKEIDKEFVNQLFACEYFCDRLAGFGQFKIKQQVEASDFSVSIIDDVMEEIADTISKTISQQFKSLEQSNTQLYDEIDRIKSMLSSSSPGNHSAPQIMTPTQTNTPIITPSSQMNLQQFPTSIFFNEELQMKQVRNTIRTLQSQILQANQSLAQSFYIQEDSICDGQKQNLQFQMLCKIDERFKTIQEKISKTLSTYGIEIEQRIQQLKKTFTSVVEAMNDPQYWVNKHDKINDMNKHCKVNKEKNNVEMFVAKNTINTVAHKQSHQFAAKQNNLSTFANNHELPNVNQSLNTTFNQKKFSTPSTGKSINSLNKSLNFGRTKIKSLFGFGPQKKQYNNHQLVIN